MTPYEIEVLLHIYCRGEDHPDEQRQPPVYEPTIQAFMDEKLIEPNPAVPPEGVRKRYAITRRGRAYVELGLTRVPLPVNDWRIPVPDFINGGKE